MAAITEMKAGPKLSEGFFEDPLITEGVPGPRVAGFNEIGVTDCGTPMFAVAFTMPPQDPIQRALYESEFQSIFDLTGPQQRYGALTQLTDDGFFREFVAHATKGSAIEALHTAGRGLKYFAEELRDKEVAYDVVERWLGPWGYEQAAVVFKRLALARCLMTNIIKNTSVAVPVHTLSLAGGSNRMGVEVARRFRPGWVIPTSFDIDGGVLSYGEGVTRALGVEANFIPGDITNRKIEKLRDSNFLTVDLLGSLDYFRRGVYGRVLGHAYNKLVPGGYLLASNIQSHDDGSLNFLAEAFLWNGGRRMEEKDVNVCEDWIRSVGFEVVAAYFLQLHPGAFARRNGGMSIKNHRNYIHNFILARKPVGAA